MRNRDIINHIRKTNTWNLGKYKLPKRLYYWSGREIDLEKDHKERMEKLSNHEEEFLRDISKYSPQHSFLREFPIPIYSLETWRKYWPKEDHVYFSLDFFFPMSGIVVEIDGTQHQDQREYDKARDDYLREEYGLTTFRVDEYGWYWPERSQEFLQTLIFQLDSSQAQSSFPLPKLDLFLENNWKDRWQVELQGMKSIQNIFGETLRKIKITKNEFRRITEGKIWTDNKYITQFNELFKGICNQEVIITL